MTNQRLPEALSPALRLKLDKLRASGPHLHHIVDIAGGQVFSERSAGPLSGAERSKRLARFGHILDGSIFGGPTYRMSSRKPFQESPRAFMTVSSADSYLTEVEFIAWGQARDPGLERGFLVVHFDEPPPGKCMATFSISAFPWSGTSGSVTVRAGASSVSIPITQSFNHTVEIVFDPAGAPTDVGFIIEPGVQVLAFFFMTLGPAPLVLTPN